MTRVNPMEAGANTDQGALAPYLETVQGSNGKVAAKAKEIAGTEQDPVKVAERLSRWVAEKIGRSSTDFGSAMETLEKEEGSSRSHARLYVAMARSLGIPSRVVNGVMYGKDRGFLFHSWAESHLGNWIAIDPTIQQFPADVTHIKLVEGDDTKDLMLLGSVVGKLKGKILEQQN
jgi:transglutaminase-like putative cysteine protease